MQSYGNIRVGDRCPRCGATITSLSIKTIKGNAYLYAYHGDKSCYLGPATAVPTRPAEGVNRYTVSRGVNREPRQQVRLDDVIAELRGLNSRLDALAETIIDLMSDVKERDRETGEKQGTSLVRVVTRSDSRRGKVHLPAGWIGKKVKVTLVE